MSMFSTQQKLLGQVVLREQSYFCAFFTKGEGFCCYFYSPPLEISSFKMNTYNY